MHQLCTDTTEVSAGSTNTTAGSTDTTAGLYRYHSILYSLYRYNRSLCMYRYYSRYVQIPQNDELKHQLKFILCKCTRKKKQK